jgi:competence protein ComEC
MRPRPVVLFVLAFGAGLATGLAHFQPLAVAFGCGACAVWLWRRDSVLLPLGALLGLAHGAVALSYAGHSCAARLPPGSVAVTVRLVDPAASGMVSAEPVGLKCHGPVLLRWPDGQNREAGRLVRVEGRWIPRQQFGGRPDGILVVKEAGVATGVPGLAARLRGWISAVVQRLFGARSAIVDALVLGTRGGIDPELRDAFARSGLVHLLSISGFHVGLLSAWVVLLLRLGRVRREAALVIAALVATGYVAFLGWQAPAVRAAALGAVAAWSLIRQRRVQPTPLLAMTCLMVLLLDPWAIFDLGGWLSASALWGATSFTRWSDHAIGRGRLAQTFFASLGATLATAPLTAAALGTVALAGLALNFLAIPLAALAVPGILAALLAASVAEPLAAAFASGSGLALAGLERLALVGSHLPGGALLVEPGWPSALPWVAVLVVASWVMADRTSGREALHRALRVVAVGLWIALAAQQVRGLGGGQRELRLFVLDVGQGDAAVLATPGGHWLVLDAGPVGEGRDAGRRVVAPFLARNGVRRLSVLLVSHAHADHLGGVGSVLDRLPADDLIEPAVPVPDSLYLALLDRADAGGVRWHPGRAGDRWEVDGVRFRLLHPDTTWAGWREDLNEDSLVLLVEYGSFRAVFAGDAGLPVEARLRGRVGHVDLLKAGHHGARAATGAAWLAELTPRAVLISVGLHNRYGHPSPPTLARIAAAGAELWRTDRDGTVSVRTDGHHVAVWAKGRTQEYDIGSGQSPGIPQR